ncbi:MAG: ROK family protein [Sphingomonadales bacterium]|nr:ROK family protein [Sphingomonadales bacterium]
MILGADIGGTKIEAVVFDDALNAIDRRRIATPATDYDAFLDAVAELVEWGDGLAGSPARVGIGFPGLVDSGERSLSANIPCATGRPVKADIAQRLGRTVALCNDTHCFALSEARDGAGRGHSRVFGAILGTGAAGGLVVDGRLERGAHGIAGEYGHQPLSASIQQRFNLPVWTCGCGLEGCSEAYVGGPGLLALARQFGLDAASTHDVVAAWRAADPIGQRTYQCFLEILAVSLANMVKLLDPDVIVMGGGLSLIDEIVVDLPGAIERNLFSGFSAPPVVAALHGDASGVRGAAILAASMERV